MKNNPMRTLFRFSVAVVLAIVFVSNLKESAFAATLNTGGVFTDDNDVRWEWKRQFDSETNQEQVSIMYYDRPAEANTITVPSLSDVIAASDASSTLNTYFLKNADEEAQQAAYEALYPKRDANQSITRLDFTNTSKIQIIGVSPILDPAQEAEIIFGENIVIGDGLDVAASVEVIPCQMYWDDSAGLYYCGLDWNDQIRIDDISTIVPGWEFLSNYEQMTYEVTPEDLGYTSLNNYVLSADEYDSNARYMIPEAITKYHSILEQGAFSGYKLKLTGLSNVKYIGWYAFKDSTFNNDNLELTIEANQTTGASAFENTNITKAVLKNTETSEKLFKDCANLTEVEFINTETVSYYTFENANIGPELDLSGTKITSILAGAFKNIGLTSVNLGNVEKIGAEAFANNNLTEVYLPKSLNDFGEENVFIGNDNLRKLTVAYDTLTTGTVNSLHNVIGENANNSGASIAENIKELVILAPYGADENVSATHIDYEEYLQNHYSGAREREENAIRLRNASAYKNIIAPGYFYGFSGVEKLTIGDGFELIGAQAFYAKPVVDGAANGAYLIDHFKDLTNNGRYTALKEVTLPETLKVIDSLAFASHSNPTFSINLPESLEYLGLYAFYYAIGMHNDIDLPNLKYLGTQAFYIAGVRNVVLHDKIEYAGYAPFMSTYYLGDVTIDFDVFASANTRGLLNSQNFTTNFFGHLFGGSGNFNVEALPDALQSLEFTTARVAKGYSSGYNARKVGTITFTNKVQATPSFDWNFNGIYAAKVDLSKTGWKSIPANAFIEAAIDELLLPENLESIGSTAFYNSRIEKELVLPNTLKVIGQGAFNNQTEVNNSYYYTDGHKCYHFREVYEGESPYCNSVATHGVSIKNLPNSIETISDYAFYGDYYLDTDFALTNIKYIGSQAFMKTGIRNVTLGSSITRIGQGAFIFDQNLNNIVIDFDFYNQSINGNQGAFYNTFNTTAPDKFSYSQDTDGSTFGDITFTAKAVTQPVNYGSIYSYFTINKFDLSKTGWTTIPSVWGMLKSKVGEVLLPETLETIPLGFFFETEVEEPVVIPATVKTIDNFAFQWSNLSVENALPEGIETINTAAFFGAKVADDMIVPNTVSFIGPSAFNAGDKDVEYNSVTIRPDLDYVKTKNQAIFQLFWNAKMKTLIIESSMLPVLGTLQDPAIMPEDIEIGGELVSPLRADGEPEFHGMHMEEVVIKNLPMITDNAFEECAELKKVDFSEDENLTTIGKYAFNNATSLKTFGFGSINNGEDIDLREYAFNHTALQVIAGKGSDFDLTAAKFNAIEPHVFANLPNLKKVVVPNTFSVFEAANNEKGTNGSTIPSGTFANDTELEEVRVNYQLSSIKDGAFINDNKIKKFFIWGNTEIEEADEPEPTIPAPTNVFAYSDSPAEAYAMKNSRADYEGKFYPLDEVLYITSNKKYVLLNDDKTDWDKTGLHLYAMRRDGVILESDEWLEYTTAYPRAMQPQIFGDGKGALYDDELAMDVYDAEKPFELVSLVNRNFEGTTFDLIQEDGKETMTLVIHYTDGYTVAVRNTSPDAVGEDELEAYLRSLIENAGGDNNEELDVPNTGSNVVTRNAVVASTSVITILAVAIELLVAKRITRRK